MARMARAVDIYPEREVPNLYESAGVYHSSRTGIQFGGSDLCAQISGSSLACSSQNLHEHAPEPDILTNNVSRGANEVFQLVGLGPAWSSFPLVRDLEIGSA